MIKKNKSVLSFILGVILVILGVNYVTRFYLEYHVGPKHEAINSIRQSVSYSLRRSRAASDLCKDIGKSPSPNDVVAVVLNLLSESNKVLDEIIFYPAITADASDAIMSLQKWNSELYSNTKIAMKCQDPIRTSEEIERWENEILTKINNSKKWY